MPDAVRLVATDEEWAEFLVWRAQPKPIMLDRHGRNPDVPHDLADDLFAQIIERLKEGELVAFGRWGEESAFQEIEPVHWATMYYNIWFNELGYAESGRFGFSSILLEQVARPMTPLAKPQVRSAVKRLFCAWTKINPDSKITRSDMLAHVRQELSREYEVSENLFNGVWRSEFPDGNKYMHRPPK